MDNMIQLDVNRFHRAIVRPVVVVTTLSRDGIPNAAPFSFCTPISFDPPVFSIACQPGHDTWRNIRETGEFVINLPGEDMGGAISVLGRKFPPDVDEIKEAGLTETQSKMVSPPRILEAYGWYECRMVKNFELGDHIFIAGKVLIAEIRAEAIDEVLKLDVARPLCHIEKRFFTVPEKMVRFDD